MGKRKIDDVQESPTVKAPKKKKEKIKVIKRLDGQGTTPWSWVGAIPIFSSGKMFLPDNDSSCTSEICMKCLNIGLVTLKSDSNANGLCVEQEKL
jgi:hypothetical protein